MELPDIEYSIPDAVLPDILASGEIPFLAQIAWLQMAAGEREDWASIDQAQLALASILASPQGDGTGTLESEEWLFEYGPVDVNERLVTIQKGEQLVVVMKKGTGGLLRTSWFRSPDGRAIERLLNMSVHPQRQRLPMGYDTSFELAWGASCGTGQLHAMEAGHSYGSVWEFGLGYGYDREPMPQWILQRELEPIPMHLVAVLLQAYLEFGPAPV